MSRRRRRSPMAKAELRRAQAAADRVIEGYLTRMEALERALDGCLEHVPEEAAEALDPAIDALADVRAFRASRGVRLQPAPAP